MQQFNISHSKLFLMKDNTANMAVLAVPRLILSLLFIPYNTYINDAI